MYFAAPILRDSAVKRAFDSARLLNGLSAREET
jgi:hypothetical protein